MKIIRKPKVYLVGEQHVVDDCIDGEDFNLDAFLQDHNVREWESDNRNAAQVLPEVAGRLCFMSYANPRPGGNKAYLEHILEASHGSVTEHAVWNFIITGVSRSLTHELIRHRAGTAFCLSGETEVYSGSKTHGKFDGVRKKWTIKQLYDWSKDPKRKGRLRLVTVRCFDGSEFVQAKIRSVAKSGVKKIFRVSLVDGKAIRCSADHRFMTTDGWKPVRDLQSGEPLATNGLPPIAMPYEDLQRRYHQEKQTLDEIAAFYKCSKHTVRKWVKRFGLQKPIETGMTGRTPPNKGTRYTTGYKHTPETKRKLADQKRGEKNPQWTGDAGSPQAGRYRARNLFPVQPCEMCGKKDGHRHHIDRNTLNNNRDNIEFLCASCHTLRHIEEDGSPTKMKIRWVSISSIVEDGEEETYDIEVDHPSHNFVANGFVTHNSQLSQRYVDESVAEYVEPAIIAEDPELHQLWVETIQRTHDAYVELANKLSDKLTRAALISSVTAKSKEITHCCVDLEKELHKKTKTEIRKQARQAARSVLPNATETKIFVTFNARSLRHFLEQRGSRHAEPEIRVLANVLLDMMQDRCPNLFGDYTREPLPDGTFEINTKYRKV